MMTEKLTRSEKRLIWIAFVFAVIAASMLLPSVAMRVFGLHSVTLEFSGGAFGMTFCLMIMAIEVFSWLGSFVMLIVNLFANRRALKTRLGVATVVLDAGLFAYVVFYISLIFFDLSTRGFVK